MFKLMIVCSLFFSANVFAATCVFTWDDNPVEQKVLRYTLYKNGKVFVESIKVSTYTMQCNKGTYWVTATNKYGESGKSDSVIFGRPSVPKNLDVVKGK